jgi:hypothetical protein
MADTIQTSPPRQIKHCHRWIATGIVLLYQIAAVAFAAFAALAFNYMGHLPKCLSSIPFTSATPAHARRLMLAQKINQFATRSNPGW